MEGFEPTLPVAGVKEIRGEESSVPRDDRNSCGEKSRMSLATSDGCRDRPVTCCMLVTTSDTEGFVVGGLGLGMDNGLIGAASVEKGPTGFLDFSDAFLDMLAAADDDACRRRSIAWWSSGS